MDSDPPEVGQDVARTILDGIMHNLTRKQNLKAQPSLKRQSGNQGPISPTPITSIAHDDAPENSKREVFTMPDVRPPRKGILKPPRVHWPEELGDLDDREMTTLPRPPPPPPPPPPPRPFAGELPILPRPDVLPAPPPPPPAMAPEPPTLFNREIEANEYLNEAAYKLYTKFIDELSEFVDQQGEVIRMRLQVQERRAELKGLRERVSRADMLLINHLRERMTQELPSVDETLLSLFEESQVARDHAGPKEAEYEPMEIKLGAAEHKLRVKYSELEHKFEHFFRLNATSTTNRSIPSRIEYESSTNSSLSRGDKEWTGMEPRDVGTLYGTLIGEHVSIGQVPMHVGSIAGNIRLPETSMLNPSTDTAEYSRKHRSSATMDDRFEDDLPPELLGIAGTEELETTNSYDIETRDRRISNSLKGVASHSLFEVLEDPGPLPDDLISDPGLQECDALLLIENQCDSQSIYDDYLYNFENTRDRINRWILHQVRVSPHGSFALRRSILDLTPGIQDWVPFVLSQWQDDLLGYNQSYHQGSIEDNEEVGPAQYPDRLDAGPEPLEPTDLAKNDLVSTLVSHMAYAETTSDFSDRILSDTGVLYPPKLNFEPIPTTSTHNLPKILPVHPIPDIVGETLPEEPRVTSSITEPSPRITQRLSPSLFSSSTSLGPATGSRQLESSQHSRSCSV